MSYTVQQLLDLTARFEKMAVDVPQPPDFDEDYRKYLEMVHPTPKDDEGAYEKWLKDRGPIDQEIEVERVEEAPADTYIRTATAKEKKKLDPKAKVRNRGVCVFPAESPSVTDHKDHFPLGDEDQARNALARSHQYDKAPPWYKGSLKSLQEAVSRKVHSKYPSIGKDKKSTKKKASLEAIDALLYEFDSEYVE